MHADLTRIFLQAHRTLKPGPTPELEADFYPFAGLNHTIRRRAGRTAVRVSDVLRDAPEDVLIALASLLFSRLDRQSANAALQQRYREYIREDSVQERARTTRETRARTSRSESGVGRHIDLEALFLSLNRRYFGSALPKPRLGWSRTASRRTLGRCDPHSRTITISRFFDSPDIPDFVIEYVLFHEMLHLQHPAKTQGSRLMAHPPEFTASVQRFPRHAAAQTWLNENLD